MTLCGCSTPPVKPEKAVIELACPELGPGDHSNFGEVAKRLLEVYEQYHICRTAALGSQHAGS